MSAAARTRSSDSELMRLMCPALVPELPRHGEVLELADAETVGHSGAVVGHAGSEVVRVRAGDRVDRLRMLEVMSEQRLDHPGHTVLLAQSRLSEIDAIEHEAPQAGHRAADLVSLDDLAGTLGVLHEVVHQQVDALAPAVAEDRDLFSRQVALCQHR